MFSVFSCCFGTELTKSFALIRAHMNADIGAEAASYGEIFDCSGAVTTITDNQIVGLAAEREEVALKQKPGPVAIVASDDNFFKKL